MAKQRNRAARKGKGGQPTAKTEAPAKTAEATETDGKTPKLGQSGQLRKYKANYTPYQAPNGSISLDNGDEVALLLRGASPEAVMKAAEKLKGLEPGTLATRYADRNVGSKRMNAGNIIRGLVRRGDKTAKDVKAALKA